jgi:hypothetical protein
MDVRIAIIAAICFFAGGVAAQEPPRVVRQIAPDRFQPNPRGDTEAKPAAAAIAPPSREHPLGGCDRATRGWLNCLRSTADLSALLVSAAESRAVASLDRRQNVSASLQRILAKALADADAKWLELREQECSQLALLEVAPGASLYEAQLVCRITHNMERVDQLTNRYGAGAS